MIRHLNRRDMLGIVAGGAVMFGGKSMAANLDTNLDPLAPTKMVQSDHPDIIALVRRVAPDDLPQNEKARRIFNFVRDEIKFGFGPRFYDLTASHIAGLRRGYCNTKGTLIVAMLRAASIPARQVFVDIDASILSGIVDPGTPFVDHSYVEILLGETWLATDAYIVDSRLFAAAQKRLKAEGKSLGYGVHNLGTKVFDETKQTFSQFVANRVPALSTQNYGVHADVEAFYEATPETWNRLTVFTRLAFPVFAASANRNAENIRNS